MIFWQVQGTGPLGRKGLSPQRVGGPNLRRAMGMGMAVDGGHQLGKLLGSQMGWVRVNLPES